MTSEGISFESFCIWRSCLRTKRRGETPGGIMAGWAMPSVLWSSSWLFGWYSVVGVYFSASACLVVLYVSGAVVLLSVSLCDGTVCQWSVVNVDVVIKGNVGRWHLLLLTFFSVHKGVVIVNNNNNNNSIISNFIDGEICGVVGAHHNQTCVKQRLMIRASTTLVEVKSMLLSVPVVTRSTSRRFILWVLIGL